MVLPPAPRGLPQIEVTFDIDVNGILNVSAKDQATGKEQKITITASTNLSDADVENLVQEAEMNRADDERLQNLVQARNEADSLIYQTEKTLNELDGKIADNDRATIEAQITDVKNAIAGDIHRYNQI